MKMSPEGVSFVRQRVAAAVEGKAFLLVLCDGKGGSVICNNLTAERAEKIIRAMASKTPNWEYSE